LSRCQTGSRAIAAAPFAPGYPILVDHATGAIVWCAAGRDAATLQASLSELAQYRVACKEVGE